MHALQRAVRDNARAPAALRAPRHLVPLRGADGADGGRRPEAEVVGVVHPEGLAHGGLGGGRAAGVGAGLAGLGFGWELVVPWREGRGRLVLGLKDESDR